MNTSFRVIGSIVLGILMVLVFGDFAFDKEWWKWFELIIGTVFLLAFLSLVFVRFTLTKAGRAKIVLCLGAYSKTIVSREGYKVASNDDIVALAPGEKPPFKLPGGLRLVGIWGIHTLHTHYSKWILIKKDEKGYSAEVGSAVQVDETLVIDQVEGLWVSQAEDKDELPLDILLAVTSEKVNPKKALLEVDNWREALDKRVSPYVTRFIAKKSYEELDEMDLENDLLTALSAGTTSVISEFLNRYGVRIRKIEVIDINPPENYREMTLKKKIGNMNAKQAVEETAGRIEATINRLTASGMTKDQAFEYAKKQIQLDRGGYTEHKEDVTIGGPDGKPLPAGSITGSLVGGAAAVANVIAEAVARALGKGGGKASGTKNPNGGEGNSGNKPKKTRPPGEFLSEEEY